MSLYDEPSSTRSPEAEAPELEFRAAEALFEQAPAFRSHVRDAVAFLEEIGPRARCALEPEIRKLPVEASTATMRTAAVDSAHKTLSTAGICAVFCAAFRTSASNSEDHRFAHAESTRIRRRARRAADALPHGGRAPQLRRRVEDQITILDNSFLSLPAAASQAVGARTLRPRLAH